MQAVSGLWGLGGGEVGAGLRKILSLSGVVCEINFL